ncbi:MAG: hypothetical protein Q9168_004773 [Polycauliona sp. 1 TL-2023]
MIRASMLLLTLCIQKAIGVPTGPQFFESPSVAQTGPPERQVEPYLSTNTALSNPAIFPRQADGIQQREDIKIIFRRFVRVVGATATAAGGPFAASGGEIPPILSFLANVTASLHSHTFLEPNSSAIDILYGGLRLYISIFDKDGIAVAGITQIPEIINRIIDVLETLADYVRRGYAGLCELMTPFVLSTIGGVTLGVVFTVWRDGFSGLGGNPPLVLPPVIPRFPGEVLG